MSASVMTLS